MQEMTGDHLPAERASKGRDLVRLSCVRERSKPRPTCDEVDAEQAAKNKKAIDGLPPETPVPCWSYSHEALLDRPSSPAASSEAAPFEEVVPVVASVQPGYPYGCDGDNVANASVVAKAPEAPKSEDASSKTSEDSSPIWSDWLCFVAFSLAVSGLLCGYHGLVLKQRPAEGFSWFAAFPVSSVLMFVATLLSADFVELISGTAIRPSKWFTKLPTLITNTALGLWTAVVTPVRGAVYAIGYAIYGIALGVYYGVPNQLALSGCLANSKRFYSWCSHSSRCNGDATAGRIFFIWIPHFLGVAASIVTVLVTDGTQLTDKLIFGWWGFYALNVFYLIGTKVQTSKKAS